ncbi:hypothetical protein V2J09_010743 [Rumex salicifolius]
MGKATRWIKGLFGMKTGRQTPAVGSSGRESGICHNPATIPPNITPAEAAWLRLYYPHDDGEEDTERSKHAIAVAAATAAAADAAVAAAQAAAEVVRLTSRGRNRSSSNNFFSGDDGIGSWAAVRIQTNFRAYLARKALRALKGLVKIQALVRGYLVRKQATATLHGMQALIRAQATVRSKRAITGPHNDPAHHPDNWARPSMVDAQSKRLSASFEARTLNPPVDQDTLKVVEVDIGHPGSRSARKGPGSRTSFSELGENPSSYQILPPQFQFETFQAQHQFAPARLSMPSHHHQCCHHYHDTEWGLTAEECRSSTAQTTPWFSSKGCRPDEMGPIPPLTPTRSGPGIFHEDLYYYNYGPSYMAKTMSFKAKVRSHSAPKQRPDPNGNCNSTISSSGRSRKKRMSLTQMIEARNSLSGVRMQRSSSQVQEAINFKNAVMGRLGRSPL